MELDVYHRPNFERAYKVRQPACFIIIRVKGPKWRIMKGIIMVKTEEDWKYQLCNNCISFFEWIDGLSLNIYRECDLVIMFYMSDSVVLISYRYKQCISCAWNNIYIVT